MECLGILPLAGTPFRQTGLPFAAASFAAITANANGETAWASAVTLLPTWTTFAGMAVMVTTTYKHFAVSITPLSRAGRVLRLLGKSVKRYPTASAALPPVRVGPTCSGPDEVC